MPRPVFRMLVLVLGFGAGPALAQSAPVPLTEADASTAARTMEQSRRVFTDRPAERPAADGAQGAVPNAPAPAQGNGKSPPPAGPGGQPPGALSGGKPVAQR
jgi:hypothetical protein